MKAIFKKYQLWLVIVFLLTVTGCVERQVAFSDLARPTTDEEILKFKLSNQIVAIRQAVPERDAERCFKRRDFRLIGDRGPFPYYLGVDDLDWAYKHENKNSFKIIFGAREFVSPGLFLIKTNYESRFNHRMWQLLTTNTP